MHMADSLVSAAVGTTMATVSTGAVGYSIRKIKDTDLNSNKIPMMGVMGAFVFAAQMINFTIPGTGSSGHIGGGILLAAILGPYPAFLTLTSVLIIQALFFADGGLLALGCNIFNMGFLACFVAYPLIYRTILKNKVTPRRLTAASILAVIIGLQLGSFFVVLETTASHITKLPFLAFLLLMQPIHLAIGTVEGIVTGAVLCFIYKSRREIVLNALKKEPLHGYTRRVLILFAVAAVIIGGFLSYFASRNPDGLEWSIQSIDKGQESTHITDTHKEAEKLQSKTAVLPEYSFGGDEKNNRLGTGVSGIVGGAITLALVGLSGCIILQIKKRKTNRTTTEVE